jgi:hypothetical protein
MTANDIVLLVEATEKVHDEGTVGDDLAQVTKLLSKFLVLVIVICHGKMALTEVPEFCVAVDGA